MKTKIAVITGDIINSTKFHTNKWQSQLKSVLKNYGKEDYDWEIHRGDYFQIRIKPEKALKAALHIKASIKQISTQLDVRMSIGIGEQNHKSKKISLSTGEAFTLSGRGFDQLKKQTLIITTSNKEKNEILNVMLALALKTINEWTKNEAQTFLIKYTHPEMTLKQISRKLKKSLSNVSETLKRSAYSEIVEMEKVFLKLLKK